MVKPMPTLHQIATARTTPNLPAVLLVPCPAWASAEKIQELFGLVPQQLARLVSAGEIRKRKMGNTKQASSLYSCFDALEWMESDQPYPIEKEKES